MAAEAKQVDREEAFRRFENFMKSYRTLKRAKEQFKQDEEAFYEVVEKQSLSDTQKLRIIST